MEINVIHIYGGSGSGTSTLGYAFSRESGYYFMDADDYLWLPTNPRFTQMRESGERVRLMKEDIKEHKKSGYFRFCYGLGRSSHPPV